MKWATLNPSSPAWFKPHLPVDMKVTVAQVVLGLISKMPCKYAEILSQLFSISFQSWIYQCTTVLNCAGLRNRCPACIEYLILIWDSLAKQNNSRPCSCMYQGQKLQPFSFLLVFPIILTTILIGKLWFHNSFWNSYIIDNFTNIILITRLFYFQIETKIFLSVPGIFLQIEVSIVWHLSSWWMMSITELSE